MVSPITPTPAFPISTSRQPMPYSSGMTGYKDSTTLSEDATGLGGQLAAQFLQALQSNFVGGEALKDAAEALKEAAGTLRQLARKLRGKKGKRKRCPRCCPTSDSQTPSTPTGGTPPSGGIRGCYPSPPTGTPPRCPVSGGGSPGGSSPGGSSPGGSSPGGPPPTTGTSGGQAPGNLPRVTPNASGAAFPVVGFQGPVGLHHGSEPGAADLMAPRGTPIVAMRGGTVTNVSTNDRYGGNNLTIQGDDGLTYYYAHMNEAPLVQQGQQVQAGQPLGTVGDSGNAKGTGTHLHLGIGYGIQTGDGPQGGAGIGFDAVGYLNQVLNGG